MDSEYAPSVVKSISSIAFHRWILSLQILIVRTERALGTPRRFRLGVRNTKGCRVGETMGDFVSQRDYDK